MEAVAPDGQSFVMATKSLGRAREIRIVEDWFEELERLVPVD